MNGGLFPMKSGVKLLRFQTKSGEKKTVFLSDKTCIERTTLVVSQINWSVSGKGYIFDLKIIISW